MSTKETDDGDDSVSSTEEKLVESQISNFAAKLGEETGGKYQVYIYRIVKDEESGRRKKPFLKKYVGVEPDPSEIAERYRGGTYLVQFIWYVGKVQKHKAYTLDIDEDAFPPLPKQSGSVVPYVGAPGMSEPMQLQLTFIHEIAEVMKAAYSQNGAAAIAPRDPLESMSGIMTTMEESYSRAMGIQSKIMERVFTRNMERTYGLGPEGGDTTETAREEEDTAGIVGKYGTIVKEVVDGLKYVFSLFGAVPPKMIEKVKKDERFKELLKDPKALLVIGKALRAEFGDEKASETMRSFGVQMVIKKAGTVVRTPDIPGTNDGAARRPVPAGTPALPSPRQIGPRKGGQVAKDKKPKAG